jgi:hypothetical protein
MLSVPTPDQSPIVASKMCAAGEHCTTRDLIFAPHLNIICSLRCVQLSCIQIAHIRRVRRTMIIIELTPSHQLLQKVIVGVFE